MLETGHEATDTQEGTDMTDKERDDMRNLQDVVLDHLAKRGFIADKTLFTDQRGNPVTMADLQEMIYPFFRDLFIAYCQENKLKYR
jgi:hypothetical protein